MSQIVSRGADISPDQHYRYQLTRVLDGGYGRCVFIMLNPSTADGSKDDATIRRCLGFVRSWGYRELRVVNLFAWRALKPKDMLRQVDPVGPMGDAWILQAVEDADCVVCAWGAAGHRVIRRRADAVRALLVNAGHTLHHLGMTAQGQPRHPLFLYADTRPVEWAS